MDPFQLILDLFVKVQHPVKRKYPAVVTYLKHLQKIQSDEGKREKEVECFKNWLLKNPIGDRVLTDPVYPGTKLSCSIYFEAIFEKVDDSLKLEIWNKLSEIELMIFPSGRPKIEEKKVADDVSPGAAAALSILEQNPVFSDVLDNVKSIVGELDPNDMSSVMESENFGKMLKTIKRGIQSGKYKISDLTGTINAVVNSVQDELDPEMRMTVSTATAMMADAEAGGRPDVGKLLQMMKSINPK